MKAYVRARLRAALCPRESADLEGDASISSASRFRAPRTIDKKSPALSLTARGQAKIEKHSYIIIDTCAWSDQICEGFAKHHAAKYVSYLCGHFKDDLFPAFAINTVDILL